MVRGFEVHRISPVTDTIVNNEKELNQKDDEILTVTN
jgi:hypothetical protein